MSIFTCYWCVNNCPVHRLRQNQEETHNGCHDWHQEVVWINKEDHPLLHRHCFVNSLHCFTAHRSCRAQLHHLMRGCFWKTGRAKTHHSAPLHVAPQILHVSLRTKKGSCVLGRFVMERTRSRVSLILRSNPALTSEKKKTLGRVGWWKRGGFFRIVEGFFSPSQTKTLALSSSYCLVAVLNRGGSCS